MKVEDNSTKKSYTVTFGPALVWFNAIVGVLIAANIIIGWM